MDPLDLRRRADHLDDLLDGPHGRGVGAELHQRMDHAVAAGRVAVMAMALLAVGREALGTALFLWAGARASGETIGPIIGAALGLATAIVIGFLFYRGALKINLRTFFTWPACS